jgi:hypothetical protein
LQFFVFYHYQHIPGQGKIASIELIKGNCQKFLDGKWNTLFRAACAFSRISTKRGMRVQPAQPAQLEFDRKCHTAHKQIQLGSLSNAYKRLTEGCLASHDPADRLLQLQLHSIGRSQPMQNDQTYFFSDIFLKTLLYYKTIILL